MKKLCLVFDDGPCEPLCKIVDKIKKYGWKAGFAIIGNKINDETEYMIRYAINNGFQLVTHGKSHISISKLDSDEEIIEELLSPIVEIKHRIGYDVTMARLPFLSGNNKVLEISKQLNLPLLGQGIDGANDWDSSTAPKTIFESVVCSASDGAIGCLHVTENTCIALDSILPALKENGFSLLTPQELFAEFEINIPLGVQINNINDYRE